MNDLFERRISTWGECWICDDDINFSLYIICRIADMLLLLSFCQETYHRIVFFYCYNARYDFALITSHVDYCCIKKSSSSSLYQWLCYYVVFIIIWKYTSSLSYNAWCHCTVGTWHEYCVACNITCMPNKNTICVINWHRGCFCNSSSMMVCKGAYTGSLFPTSRLFKF